MSCRYRTVPVCLMQQRSKQGKVLILIVIPEIMMYNEIDRNCPSSSTPQNGSVQSSILRLTDVWSCLHFLFPLVASPPSGFLNPATICVLGVLSKDVRKRILTDKNENLAFQLLFFHLYYFFCLLLVAFILISYWPRIMSALFHRCQLAQSYGLDFVKRVTGKCVCFTALMYPYGLLYPTF